MSEPDFVRVRNNEARIFYLPDRLPPVSDLDKAGAMWSELGAGKALVPGENNVDAKEWADAKAHKNGQVAGWLKAVNPRTGKPLVEEGGDTSKPEGIQSPESLAAYGVDTSKAMIEVEADHAVLSKWRTDTRPDVREAVKRRLEALGGAKKK